MDLGFASRGQDIWIVQAKGILDISERMNNLLLALRTMVNRNRLELMVVTTWEIIEALGIMGHPFVDPFWDTFAYLWKARFSSNPPTFASDFGLGDINLSMKLQKVINAKG
jgi:hypothetical protein